MQILDALAERSNVKMFFHHGLRRMSLDQNTVEFENMFVCLPGQFFLLYGGLLSFNCRDTKETVVVRTDLVVGADGAHSATRKMLQRSVR